MEGIDLAQLAPPPVPLEGERRVITAMFADVKGSTALADRIDVEAWVETMSHVLQILTTEIYRYGGEVDQFRGDGLVAFFGITVTHEDDPERAVLAALAMQEAIQRHAAALSEREGIELLLRVGVNTGEVIAAHVGDRRQHSEETAMGRAISLAARMETAAEPGTVLVSENTYRLVAPLFEWQALAEITVKGVSQPIAVYRPLAHRADPSKGRGIAGLESPLVGRDAEVRALQESIDRLQSGVGGIVTVVGEAGIGKSRLVAQVRKQTLAKGSEPLPGWWVEGRCLSYTTGMAYQLWLDMLRGLLGIAADASPIAARDALREWVRALCPERFGDVYPYLGQMMSLPLEDEVEARLRGLDAETIQYLTFRAIETAIESAARQRTLVITCEDLHWADPTSLELLEDLLPLTGRVSLLFICVLRPERRHAGWRVIEIAARDYPHCHTDLRLEPLSPVESATLVGNLLHVEDLPRALRDCVLDHAEGNPFYVEEVLRSLISEGVIVYDEASGRWRATRDVSDIPIPDTLHGVIAGRSVRLPEAARRTLQRASVVGRIFTYPVLAAIATDSPLPFGGEHLASLREASRGPGVRGKTLDDHLFTLQRAQMIRERARLPEREYGFKHHLTQEAAYGGLLVREQRATHRQVAEAMEKLYPERVEEQLGLLAHHWERAEETERAVDYMRRAGEQSAARFASAEALAYLSRALELASKEDLQGRYALLLTRERVYALQGDREAQGRDLASLGELAEALDDEQRLAEVAVRQARYLHRIGKDVKAVSAARAAVRLAQAAQDVRSEAMGYREWGRALYEQGQEESALPFLERALALARDAGLHQVEVETLHTLGNVYNYLGDIGKQMACWEQELRLCRQMGDRRREGEALRDVGLVFQRQDNYIEAEDHFRQSLRVCRETGNRRDEAWALGCRGGVSYFQGDYAAARNDGEQGLRICREVHDRVGERVALRYLGYFCIALADYAAARDYLEQALRVYREAGRQSAENRALVMLGLVLHLQGDYASAGTHYEQALRIGREMDDQRIQAAALLCAGLLSHHLGDDCAAHEYSQQARLIAPHRDVRVITDLRYALLVLGHALAGLGRPAEAADAYRQALTLWREKGQHHLAVEPLAGLARVSLAQGDPAGALAHTEEILSYLETRPALEGTLEPLRIYLTCHNVLQANGDPRAVEILDAAYRLLQERAAGIDDENLRRSFLENVAAHREIIAAWEESSHA